MFVAVLFMITLNWKQPVHFGWWLYKLIVVHLYNDTLHSNKREETADTLKKNIDKSQLNYVQWEKSDKSLQTVWFHLYYCSGKAHL